MLSYFITKINFGKNNTDRRLFRQVFSKRKTIIFISAVNGDSRELESQIICFILSRILQLIIINHFKNIIFSTKILINSFIFSIIRLSLSSNLNNNFYL